MRRWFPCQPESANMWYLIFMIPNDNQLMQEVAEGSLAAFERLVDRWDRRMLNFLARSANSIEAAEDLRQELFLRLFTHCKQFRPESHFPSWLYRIATNLVIDQVSRKRRPPMEAIDAAFLDTYSQITSRDVNSGRSIVQSNELKAMLEQSLSALPQEQRIALVLRHYEGLSFQQIAEIVGATESTVKSRVYRGLTAMRKTMKRLGVLNADGFQLASP